MGRRGGVDGGIRGCVVNQRPGSRLVPDVNRAGAFAALAGEGTATAAAVTELVGTALGGASASFLAGAVADGAFGCVAHRTELLTERCSSSHYAAPACA